MKTSKPNATQIWKQIEDVLVPRLRLFVKDRAVYSHSCATLATKEGGNSAFPFPGSRVAFTFRTGPYVDPCAVSPGTAFCDCLGVANKAM